MHNRTLRLRSHLHIGLWLLAALLPIFIGEIDSLIIIPGMLLANIAGISVLIYFFQRFRKPYEFSSANANIPAVNTFVGIIYIIGALFLVPAYTQWSILGVIVALIFLGASIFLFRILPFVGGRRGTGAVWVFAVFFMFLLTATLLLMLQAGWGKYNQHWELTNLFFLPSTLLASMSAGLSLAMFNGPDRGPKEEAAPAGNQNRYWNLASVSHRWPVASLKWVAAAKKEPHIKIVQALMNAQKRLPKAYYLWAPWKGEQIRQLEAEIIREVELRTYHNQFLKQQNLQTWCTQCRVFGHSGTVQSNRWAFCPSCQSDQFLITYPSHMMGILGPSNYHAGEVNIWDNETKSYLPAMVNGIILRNTPEVNLDWFASVFCAWWAEQPSAKLVQGFIFVIPEGTHISENSIRLLKNLTPCPLILPTL